MCVRQHHRTDARTINWPRHLGQVFRFLYAEPFMRGGENRIPMGLPPGEQCVIAGGVFQTRAEPSARLIPVRGAIRGDDGE